MDQPTDEPTQKEDRAGRPAPSAPERSGVLDDDFADESDVDEFDDDDGLDEDDGAAERRALLVSALVGVVVNAVLVAVWAATGGGGFWPGFTIGGWVLALGVQAFAAYGPPSA